MNGHLDSFSNDYLCQQGSWGLKSYDLPKPSWLYADRTWNKTYLCALIFNAVNSDIAKDPKKGELTPIFSFLMP